MRSRSVRGALRTDAAPPYSSWASAEWAALYNVVASLAQANLIVSVDRGPGLALYEIAESWHHHFVCTDCGVVVDVPCVEGTKPCLQPRLEGARLDEAQIIFRGTCPACLARGV